MKQRIVYVPVVTETQLAKLSALVDAFDTMCERLNNLMLEISSSLDVLRSQNHPEGWADVQVVRDDAVKRVLVVEHRSWRPVPAPPEP